MGECEFGWWRKSGSKETERKVNSTLQSAIAVITLRG